MNIGMHAVSADLFISEKYAYMSVAIGMTKILDH